MEFSSIFNQVKLERDNFRSQDIQIVEGYKFNQYKTLNRIELYYNGKFETGAVDPEGYDKYFYNDTKPVVLTGEKAIDLDVKDIRGNADDDVSDMAVWFLNKELKQYLRDQKFGGKLNQWGNWFPKYGSIVSKNVGGEDLPLPIMTLINDQRADSLFDSPYIIEEHEYTLADLLRLDQDTPWQNIEALVAKLQAGAVNDTVKVYEVRQIGPRRWFEDKKTSDELVWGFAVIADIDNVIQITQDPKGGKLENPYFESNGMYLFRAVGDDRDIYKERHWDKIPGRWLGVGEAETVFDPQVRQNELVNLKARALHWKSRQIFWTADDIIQRNLFLDIPDGTVIQSKNGINAVGYNNQDLAAYAQEEQRWDQKVKALTFSYDAQVGEELPSGTPFREAALLAGKSGEYFAKKREEFGLFISEILGASVMKQFTKDNKGEHKFNFTNEDPDDKKHLIELAVLTEAQNVLADYYEKTGKIPSDAQVEQEMQTARQRVASRKGLYVMLAADFYKNIKYHFDFVVTQEQIDLNNNLAALSNLLVRIASNPAVLDDPRIGKLLDVIMRKSGVNPAELGFDKKLTSVLPSQNGVQPGTPPPMPMPIPQMNSMAGATL